ncbi:MAG TPA: hypothetical protein VIP77_04790 [Jiangellaceae bacterium]
MISPELRDKITAVTTTIRADIANDMRDLEGKPLDGRTVAEAFGNLASQVDALAGMLHAIAEDPSC